MRFALKREFEQLVTPDYARQKVITQNPGTIIVDPSAGNDDPFNDGVLTPVGTIRAAMKLMASRQFIWRNHWTNQTLVRLKATGWASFYADYGVQPDTIGEYLPISSGTMFGEWKYLDLGSLPPPLPLMTFQIDHFSNDNTRWWQPAGNPDWPWWLGQYGAFARVLANPPRSYIEPELNYDYYPIMRVWDHSIMVCATFAPDGPRPLPLVGDTVDIMYPNTLVHTYSPCTGFLSGQPQGPGDLVFHGLDFTFTGENIPTVQFDNTTVTFQSCTFGGHPTYPNNINFKALRSKLVFKNCFFWWGGPGFYVEDCDVTLDDCVAMSSDSILKAVRSRVRLLNGIHSWSSGPSVILQERSTGYDRLAVAHKHRNSPLEPNGAVWQCVDPGQEVFMQTPARVLDSEPPDIWVEMAGPGNIVSAPDRAEAAQESFLLYQTTGDLNLSLADLVNVHGGRLYAENGIDVQAIIAP